MNILNSLLLFLTISCSAQNYPAEFLENTCDYKTDGSGKSLGLKLKLSVPCAWIQSDGDRPHVVRKFSKTIDNYTISHNFTVNKLEYTPDQAEVSELFSEEGLIEFSKDNSEFISGRKLIIEGLTCGEVLSKVVRETTVGKVYGFNLQYLVIYKNYMIVLSYGLGSPSENTVDTQFDLYKPLFQGLAAKFVIISKWE